MVGIAIFVSGSYAGTWLFNFWPKTSDKILEKYLDNSKWWLSSDKHIPPFAVAFYVCFLIYAGLKRDLIIELVILFSLFSSKKGIIC